MRSVDGSTGGEITLIWSIHRTKVCFQHLNPYEELVHPTITLLHNQAQRWTDTLLYECPLDSELQHVLFYLLLKS